MKRSIYLLHHLRENFGIGHGCSVNWTINNNGCFKVFSEIIPVSEVRPISAVKIPDVNLSMKLFSEDKKHQTLDLLFLSNLEHSQIIFSKFLAGSHPMVLIFLFL